MDFHFREILRPMVPNFWTSPGKKAVENFMEVWYHIKITCTDPLRKRGMGVTKR